MKYVQGHSTPVNAFAGRGMECGEGRGLEAYRVRNGVVHECKLGGGIHHSLRTTDTAHYANRSFRVESVLLVPTLVTSHAKLRVKLRAE